MQQRESKIWLKKACVESGFALVELLIAMTMLAIALMGTMGLVVMAMEANTRSKTDTTATILDQEIIEKFSTLKQYPVPTQLVTVYDCALNGANAHEASLGKGASPAGAGATLYTAATAPLPAQIGDIDWTAPVPVLATAAVQGYAMEYQSCSGDIYEVRWNVMDLTPNPPPAGSTGRLSLLTVSARQRTAVRSSQSTIFALPTTLRSLIED